MYYQTRFGIKRISSSEDRVETVIFDHMNPCCYLENSKPIFLQALRLKMMHHNTKFGNKMFGGLEDIIWINMDILTLHCDLDLECSNTIFHKTLWLMMMYHQTQFGSKGINS